MNNEIKTLIPKEDFVEVVYGDTDSCDRDTIIHTDSGDFTIEELFEQSSENNKKITHNGVELTTPTVKILNWNDKLDYANIKYISRHYVTKKKWQLKTKSGKSVIVTEDHSLIVFRNGKKIEVKPRNVLSTDKTLVLCISDYIFDEIESCECIGEFVNEPVFDIEVADESHTFIANDILVHNSLYISYEKLLNSIKGSENWSLEQKRDLIIKFNQEFLDKHNKDFIDSYFESRHGHSVHNFELETLNLSGAWLDVKKRYAQILLWKDGKTYDLDSLPLKVKGLEMVKGSYPELARNGLKKIVRALLETSKKGTDLVIKLNKISQEERKKWMTAPIEDLCENKNINGYTKYILSDSGGTGVEVASKCPYHIRALANRNWTINTKHVKGELQYGGKMKVYPVKKQHNKNQDQHFAFMAGELPNWAEQYWPCDRNACFQKFFLDPINRILTAIGEIPLRQDGYIEIGLF